MASASGPKTSLSNSKSGYGGVYAAAHGHCEQRVRCPCGNRGHVNLEDWDEFACDINDITSLWYDTIDQEAISQEVDGWKLRVEIVDGFCYPCRRLLEFLPDYLSNNNQPGKHARTGEEFKSGLSRPHFQCTAEFQASCQRGCRLCILLDQCLERRYPAGHNIETFYKIESRSRCLGKPTTIYIMAEEREYHAQFPFDGGRAGPGKPIIETLFLDIPGKRSDWSFSILGQVVAIPIDPSGEWR